MRVKTQKEIKRGSSEKCIDEEEQNEKADETTKLNKGRSICFFYGLSIPYRLVKGRKY